MDTQYLSMVANPSIGFSDPDDSATTQREIDAYFKQLNLARIDFIEFLSKCSKEKAIAYLDELSDVLKVYRSYNNRTLVGPASTALRSLLQNFDGVRYHSWIIDKVVSGHIQSIVKVKDFVRTISSEKASLFNEEPEDVQIEPNIDVAESSETPLQKHVSGVEKPAVISGTQGLADAIGCSKSMAFSIISSRLLEKEGIQYMVGKCWKFNRVKLEEYLSANPGILSKVRCKR